MGFAEMLRYLRKSSDLTQFQLAEKTGISRSSINNYENGIREPDFDTLELFADYFNVSMERMLGKEDHPRQLPDDLCTLIGAWDRMSEEDHAIIRIIADKYR